MPDGDYAYQDLPTCFRKPYERLCESISEGTSDDSDTRALERGLKRAVQNRGDLPVQILRDFTKLYKQPLFLVTEPDPNGVERELDDLIKEAISEVRSPRCREELRSVLLYASRTKDKLAMSGRPVLDVIEYWIKHIFDRDCVRSANQLNKHHEDVSGQAVRHEFEKQEELLSPYISNLAKQLVDGKKVSDLRVKRTPKIDGEELDNLPL